MSRKHTPIIQGSGGGKGGGESATEVPNTLRSKSVARVVDAISEGEIKGLAKGSEGVYFDETPLIDADGVRNFEGVEYKLRPGLPEPDPVPGFPSVERVNSVSVELRNGSPITRSITDADVNAARVTIRLPQLMIAEKDSGDIVGTSVDISIKVSGDGGATWTEAVRDTIAGKTNAPYEEDYRVERPDGATSWSIRVSRLTENADKSHIRDKTVWQFYTELIDYKLTYPDTAAIALTVDSKQFGGRIPKRSYLIDGLLIEIPSNYDPLTREYQGAWDGTFKVDWTDNPAWVFRDLIVNNRYGLGQWIAPEQVDKWSLYEIAQHCDAVDENGVFVGVPDGKGGVEPRYTFNTVIRRRKDAMKVLQLVAAIWHGMAYWTTGTVTATQDRPQDPVILVTPSNVIDGIFTYEGTGYKARHSVVLVTWNDPEQHYKTAIEVVEDPDLIRVTGWRAKEVTAWGCTSRGQAIRTGRWILDTEKHETETVTYRASLDHMIADGQAVMPGDIVKVADPSTAGVRHGGRLISATDTKTVTLDAPVTLESTETHALSVVMPDGSVAERDVATASGQTTDTLTLATGLPEIPKIGAVWVITASNLAPRQFRVVQISEVEKNIVEVTAAEHDPTKYARIERDLDVEPPTYTKLPEGPVEKPTGFAVTSYVRYEGSDTKLNILVSWNPPYDGRVSRSELQMRGPGEPEWTTLAEVDRSSYVIRDTRDGAYLFRVRSLTANGRPSDWEVMSFEAQTPTTKLQPPRRPGGLRLKNGSEVDGIAVFNNSDAGFEWRRPKSPTAPQDSILDGPQGVDTGGGDPYFQDYLIEIREAAYTTTEENGTVYQGIQEGALLRTDIASSEAYIYSLDKNLDDGGPTRSFTIRVWTRRKNGVISTAPAILRVRNPAPPLPDNIRVESKIGEIQVAFDPPSVGDWAGALIWVEDTSGYDPLNTTPFLRTSSSSSSIKVPQTKTDYYIRVAAIDTYGPDPAGLNVSGELLGTAYSFDGGDQKPDKVTGLHARQVPAGLEIRWTNPSDPKWDYTEVFAHRIDQRQNTDPDFGYAESFGPFDISRSRGFIFEQRILTRAELHDEFLRATNDDITDDTFVTRLYEKWLERTPSQSEVDWWVNNSLVNGVSRTKTEIDFLTGASGNGSGELSDGDFVIRMYELFLDRHPLNDPAPDGSPDDSAGYNFWLDRVKESGITRGMVRQEFLVATMEAELSVQAYIEKLFEVYLNNPTPASSALDPWLETASIRGDRFRFWVRPVSLNGVRGDPAGPVDFTIGRVAQGDIDQSTQVQVGLTPPDTVSNLVTNSVSNGTRLSWDNPEEPPRFVRAYIAQGSGASRPSTPSLVASGDQVVVDYLQPDTTYTVWVQPTNGPGRDGAIVGPTEVTTGSSPGGADWASNLLNIPDRFKDNATTGVNVTDNYLGYYDGSQFQSYIANDGTFQFRGNGSNYINWDGATLNIVGAITVGNPSGVRTDLNVEYGADKTSSNTANDVNVGGSRNVAQSGADKTSSNTANDTSKVNGTSASTVKSNAASGATFTSTDAGSLAYKNNVNWGADLLSIPNRFRDSASTGLNVTASYLGYYDGSQFQSYIASDGKFQFRGDYQNYINWNGSSLNIRGSITIENPSGARSDLNVEYGADQTSSNTANDTSNVNGKSSSTVRSEAEAGATFTSSNAGDLAYRTTINGSHIETGSIFASVEIESGFFRTTSGSYGGEVLIGRTDSGSISEKRIGTYQGVTAAPEAILDADGVNGPGADYLARFFGSSVLNGIYAYSEKDYAAYLRSSFDTALYVDGDATFNGSVSGITASDVGALDDSTTASDIGGLESSQWAFAGRDLEHNGRRALVGFSNRLAINYLNDFGKVESNGDLVVLGNISKNGGTFDVKHPDPEKPHKRLRHSFVESPTAGDNVYRYRVTASFSFEVVTIDLPDYWKHLNENPQVWVSPDGLSLARASGEVTDDLTQIRVLCEQPGVYNVLLIGTRKDTDAVEHWNKLGVEYAPG